MYTGMYLSWLTAPNNLYVHIQTVCISTCSIQTQLVGGRVQELALYKARHNVLIQQMGGRVLELAPCYRLDTMCRYGRWEGMYIEG